LYIFQKAFVIRPQVCCYGSSICSVMIDKIPARELDLQSVEVKNAALLFRAVNNRLRLKILQILSRKGSVTVTELYLQLGLEQSVTSQHLAILRRAHLVDTKREGKYIYYSVNLHQLSHLHQQAQNLLLWTEPRSGTDRA
jgi:DNA-binding transcriptional ArsR family regulator